MKTEENTTIDHVGIKVRDLEKSIKFYSMVLQPLGLEEQNGSFGPLAISEGKERTIMHLAFRTGKRANVDAFYKAALMAGGKDNGPPGVRADYGASYYAAFVFDLDGNNLEAVCLAG